MVRSCWVCKTAGNDSKKSYFRIPKIASHRNKGVLELSSLRRKKWCKILKCPENLSGVRICSDHFFSGHPAGLLDKDDVDWVPSKNLQFVKQRKQSTSKTVKKITVAKSKTATPDNSKSNTTLCRFCAKMIMKHLCVNIFEDENYEKLLKNAAAVLSHSISVLDKLPQFACRPCTRKIEICGEWIAEFRNAEKQLIETYIENESSDILGDLDSILLHALNDDLTLDETRMQWREEKIKEIFEEIERSDRCDLKRAVQNDGIIEVEKATTTTTTSLVFDEKQIKSIVESDSSDSEREECDTGTLRVVKKRKHSAQSNKLSSLEKKTSKCNNCFEKFDSIDDLQIHKNFCKLYYCYLCKPQIVFKDKSEQNCHKKNFHSDLFVCQICGNYYSQSYLIKHFKNHFENKRKCTVCDKVLKNSTLLTAHVEKIHRNRCSQICEICGGTFKNLKKHLKQCKTATE